MSDELNQGKLKMKIKQRLGDLGLVMATDESEVDPDHMVEVVTVACQAWGIQLSKKLEPPPATYTVKELAKFIFENHLPVG